ncbi:aminopeptidase P family N-terminal domain-containing protein [uncultured Metabacillus sp.]|uniref:aminopeptidase P family N-terminal domain-containing protein n=1 Tax=uncultured Metabacillus sp. TaxID=2860135 RepID=UPI0026027FB4|nr:aminopeptidase P family N-terminal domain-containing protein [uncultured Metabacillus sp.]
MVVPISKRLEYVQLKLAILREYLREKKYEAVLLQRQENISWLTCSDLDEPPYNLELGKFALLVTVDQFFLIANNLEVSRMIFNEIPGLKLTVAQYSCYESIEKEVNGIIRSGNVSSDTEITSFQTDTLQLEELRFSILR